ncbi:MAG: 16S rRNA (guanine(527)-N(7))-methyltransferase RsmG [Bryobacterales bacterium]|nr:16S rRNA (guanine(527)-N(7))-methyltransferase RsmG [Bryobacterales bacterium]
MSDFTTLLVEELGPELAPSYEQGSLLEAHYQALLKWNRVLNLTRITELRWAVRRHYGESLFLGSHLPPGPLRVADIGSGGGFPGIPVAIVRPEVEVTLVESHQRKAVFLRESTRRLPNVRVASIRSEALHEGSFDWMVSRAVRWEDVLALRLAANVGLLLSNSDVEGLKSRARGWVVEKIQSVPWNAQSSLVTATLADGSGI